MDLMDHHINVEVAGKTNRNLIIKRHVSHVNGTTGDRGLAVVKLVDLELNHGTGRAPVLTDLVGHQVSVAEAAKHNMNAIIKPHVSHVHGTTGDHGPKGVTHADKEPKTEIGPANVQMAPLDLHINVEAAATEKANLTIKDPVSHVHGTTGDHGPLGVTHVDQE